MLTNHLRSVSLTLVLLFSVTASRGILPTQLTDTRAVGTRMQTIQYEFDPNTPDVLVREKAFDGEYVSTYNIANHVEQRGDGYSRSFTFSGNKLTQVTNFRGQSFINQFDAAGWVNATTDNNGQTTHYNRNNPAFNLNNVTYPDGGQVAYSYTDSNNPYYVATITDQLVHTTKFTRDNNNRVIRIDYPNGAFETFGYNFSAK